MDKISTNLVKIRLEQAKVKQLWDLKYIKNKYTFLVINIVEYMKRKK